MLFSAFPKAFYSFNTEGNDVKLVTNIFSRVSINDSVLNNVYSFYKYELKDDDTPEIVAQKEYGNPEFHWVICYVNRLEDPVFDFPLPRDALERYIVKKYNYSSIAQAYSEIKHYVETIENTLKEVDGPTTKTVSNNIITLSQYDHTINALVVKTPASIVSSNAVFRANNSNANSAVTATLNTISKIGSMSVYDYEDNENESKRFIKMLKQQYVEALTNELSSVLNG